MSIYVSWGEEHYQYNRDNKLYNSGDFKWYRYMMNVKRGWILSHPMIYVKTKDENNVIHGKYVCNCGCDMRIMERTRGLLYIESWISEGNNKLYKKEVSVDDLIQEFHEEFGEESHYWGMNGDTWTLSIPVEELKIKMKEVQ